MSDHARDVVLLFSHRAMRAAAGMRSDPDWPVLFAGCAYATRGAICSRIAWKSQPTALVGQKPGGQPRQLDRKHRSAPPQEGCGYSGQVWGCRWELGPQYQTSWLTEASGWDGDPEQS